MKEQLQKEKRPETETRKILKKLKIKQIEKLLQTETKKKNWIKEKNP